MSQRFDFGRGVASAHIVPIFFRTHRLPPHFDTLSATILKWQVRLSVVGCDVYPRKCSFENGLSFYPLEEPEPMRLIAAKPTPENTLVECQACFDG